MGKGMKHYPIEFRQTVVREHSEDGLSISYLCVKYGIHKRQINNWCKWTKEYGVPKQMTGKQRGRSKAESSEETLEQKVKRLEMENALLKKYRELLKEEHKRK